jgi:predicted amidohydrolase YtcJ
MFSLAPAYAAFQVQDLGSIEDGKLADFTVLSADIMTVHSAQILTSHVVMTIIGAEVVFPAPDQPFTYLANPISERSSRSVE